MLTAWRETVPAALFAAGTRIAREIPVVLILEGIGFVGAIIVGSMIQQDMVPERFESHIRLAPSSSSGSQSGGNSFGIRRMP